MNRQQQLQEAKIGDWDVIVIGGGATGLGTAVDAATRGFRVLLLEQSDFAKATSSRATKLVHGGVRYLAQGDIHLVREALHERGLLLANAPHLTRNQRFIIPYYKSWQGAFYGAGLMFYDLLSGKLSLGPSRHLSRQHTLEVLPTVKSSGLKGGIVYHDGQFDDARLAINLAQTAVDQGGVVINYIKVTGLVKGANGKLAGVVAQDLETGESASFTGKVIINATGVFVDEILQLDKPGAAPTVRPSQGVHLVLDASFLQSDSAIMIPKTADGRVLFAVPWHGRTLIGTTDTPLDNHSLEPVALEREIKFILDTAGGYLQRAPTRADVLSVYAGLRPLAAPQKNAGSTKEISRSHKIITSPSGLITVIGGKWTTYRKMAEDTMDTAIKNGVLPAAACITDTLHIHGYAPFQDGVLGIYGSDAVHVQALIAAEPALGELIHPRLPYLKAQVVWAVHQEMARTVDDVLARRTRAILLDARAAIESAPTVAALMAAGLGKDENWINNQIQTFTQIAEKYTLA
jgi:glycerol-3-phosphate dehydrogenase